MTFDAPNQDGGMAMHSGILNGDKTIIARRIRARLHSDILQVRRKIREIIVHLSIRFGEMFEMMQLHDAFIQITCAKIMK